MDKEPHNNHEISNKVSSLRDGDRDKNLELDGSGSLLLRASLDGFRQSTMSDLGLQWGNKKRLRFMKNRERCFKPSNGYPSLRQRAPSPQQPPPRILRNNTEISGTMRGTQTQINGSVRGIGSPERGAQDKRGTHTHLNDNNNNNRSAGSSDNALDGKKGGGSSSGSGDATPAVWPPKFVIALTNKEKEEDFMAIKGSKLPQRPKKRAKLIQRTLNLVSPGTWLSDLTLERYEVREKKITKKRPRGLKAMGNVDSESE
ncbi:unnamed protein product [Vicia faba]|uniref:Uncharacterized protein n=1 Tax=Vicia faba TaxID=3906 RepID=A0AAV1AAN6_VICFA|nr:unnamed protein product [Vicia faba]